MWIKILFLGLVLLVLVLSTAGQAQQPIKSSPVTAQWSDEQANSQPIIWMKNTYSYQPSAWMTGDNSAWKIWFCGGGASGTSGDSIFYTTVNPTSKAAAEPAAILKPPNSDVAEDGQHACAPSVIKHAERDI